MPRTNEPRKPPKPQEGEGREGALTDEAISQENPGTVVSGSDTPGGGGTRPLEFDEQGRAIPPAEQGRHGGQDCSRP